MNGTAELPDTPWQEEVFATRLPKPKTRGLIKSTPSDFVVIERLGYVPDGAGEHVYIDLTKTEANTAWVAGQMAEFAGVHKRDVGYAGRKDRHAVTRQWFSVYLPKQEPKWTQLNIDGAQIHQVVRHKAKLRRGEIEANQFELIVRFAGEIDQSEIENRLSDIREHGFPNYFGLQRFGRDLHNLERADQLLRCRVRQGGDRGMLISAARSWLFNRYLSTKIETADLSGTGPLYGKSRDPQPGEDGLGDIYTSWVAGLRKLGAKVGERNLLARADDLAWVFQADELKLGFSLGPGSYATSLLSEIFDVADAAL